MKTLLAALLIFGAAACTDPYVPTGNSPGPANDHPVPQHTDK